MKGKNRYAFLIILITSIIYIINLFKTDQKKFKRRHKNADSEYDHDADLNLFEDLRKKEAEEESRRRSQGYYSQSQLNFFKNRNSNLNSHANNNNNNNNNYINRKWQEQSIEFEDEFNLSSNEIDIQNNLKNSNQDQFLRYKEENEIMLLNQFKILSNNLFNVDRNKTLSTFGHLYYDNSHSNSNDKNQNYNQNSFQSVQKVQKLSNGHVSLQDSSLFNNDNNNDNAEYENLFKNFKSAFSNQRDLENFKHQRDSHNNNNNENDNSNSLYSSKSSSSNFNSNSNSKDFIKTCTMDTCFNRSKCSNSDLTIYIYEDAFINIKYRLDLNSVLLKIPGP